VGKLTFSGISGLGFMANISSLVLNF